MFNPSNDTKLQSLQKATDSALSIFTQTLQKLVNVNETINSESVKAEEEMAKLEKFKVELSNKKSINDKLISKINAIIQD